MVRSRCMVVVFTAVALLLAGVVFLAVALPARVWRAIAPRGQRRGAGARIPRR
ncbi:MAG: hypothetical protein OXG19_07030 [Chloroflexi bacterium]|nr:hypothetical protein [Chloroflexota bacterium]